MVTPKQSRWKRLNKKLHDKYRLVIMNDSTFERKVSFRLTRMNVFVVVGTAVILLIIATTFIIAYTPLREYIPGYGDVRVQRDIYKLLLKTDSIEQEIARRNLYLENLKYIIAGKDFPNPDLKKPSDSAGNQYMALDFSITPEDSELRKYFEAEDKYNLTFNEDKAAKNSISSFFFFTPVKGIIINGFNPAKRHFGVDILAQKNDAVKSTLDGTVIFTGWMLETGYVISIQHSNNIISVYKHNSVLLKKPGDYVKAGEPIAIVGNSGEFTSGPHLHFELWHGGSPANPINYMSFE
ncbi:MAG: M23 family metallopeptidase [Bacteroidales bacterium]|jgi:murein DD-endopeptidase MepM/ murein hydrolase activator NlpD|nr:M23 family metallopeptidase [Bacteroidales bacterium]MDD4213176.1 M23 family metallopeptidase [Bacteroidales bacterium]